MALTSFIMSLGLEAQVLALGLGLEGLGLYVLDSNTAWHKQQRICGTMIKECA